MVDVVYTWVDGENEAYREACRAHGGTPSELNPERYRDVGQLLRYSLRSLHAHLRCDFRHIYIVTQRPQVPAWLDLTHPRIKLVHHDEIFEDPAHLPTFSSNAIELQLHRIPGLAGRFVYFNDDFLLGREVTSADLMDEAGRPRYAPRADANEHVPHLVIGSQVEEMIAARPALFGEMLRARFRRSNHYPLDIAYKAFLVERDAGTSYSDGFLWRHRLTWRLGDNAETDWRPLDALCTSLLGTKIGRTAVWRWLTRAVLTYCRWARPKFICLNDDLGERPDPRYLVLLQRFVDTMYPEPSPYEKRVAG